MRQIIDPVYALAGFGVAVLVGLTGVGGGSLMTPLLVLAFGIHPTTAVGTDLLFACATKSVGTAVHGWCGTVDWQVVRRLAAGSVPATAATLLVLAHYHHHLGGIEYSLKTVLGVALILTAISLLFRKWVLAALTKRMGELSPRAAAVLTALLGAILGILVSVSSVGAGAIGMTFLLALYPKLPAAKIVGSDIAHAVPLTLVAGLGHWMMGSVDWALLGSLLAGSLPGIVVGSWLAVRMPEKILRPIMGGTLALVGLKLTI